MSDTVLSIGANNGNENETTIDNNTLRDAVAVLRAINHPLRQKMIKLLDQSKGLTVTEIYIKLRLEQSVASQHLAILRNVGVLNTDRDGKFIQYTVNSDRLKEISHLMDAIVQKQ